MHNKLDFKYVYEEQIINNKTFKRWAFINFAQFEEVKKAKKRIEEGKKHMRTN